MATNNSVDDMLGRYGDLQGSSLTIDLLEPEVASKPAQSSKLVPSNSKSNCVMFCSKNKLGQPTFARSTDTNGMQGYCTEAKWQAPLEEGSEQIIFVEKVIGQTKREAEGDAAMKLQKRISDWLNTHKPADLGNFKGELQQFILNNGNRLMPAKYDTEKDNLDHSTFACTLFVVDNVTGEYTTNGSGVGKRTAEREAARKMLLKLTNIIESPPPHDTPTYKNDLDKLQHNIQATFPNYTIEYVPINTDSEVRYILQSCSLVLRKDNFPSVVVASGSGLKIEDARLACAKLALQYFSELKNIIK